MKRNLLLAVLGALLAVMALPAVASAEPAFTQPSDCTGGKKSTYFLFEYNDSAEVGRDSGCATQNDITSAQVPGLIATELHVSCSDSFPNGIPVKSDLGDPDRRVVAYTIIKDGGKKTCGMGTPCTDPDPEVCFPDTEIPAGGPIGYMAALGGLGAVYLVVRNVRRRNAAVDPTPAG